MIADIMFAPLDFVVHSIAAPLNKPDGNHIVLITEYDRLGESDAEYVGSIPPRMVHVLIRERYFLQTYLFNCIRTPSAVLHVQTTSIPLFPHDGYHLLAHECAPQEIATQGSDAVCYALPEWFPHLQNDYQLRRVGYGYHYLHHAPHCQTLSSGLLLQGWSYG